MHKQVQKRMAVQRMSSKAHTLDLPEKAGVNNTPAPVRLIQQSLPVLPAE